MKTFWTGLMAAALGVLVGCGSSDTHTTGKVTNKVGGPGATQSSDRSGSLLGPKEGEFELSVPLLATKIKQGASDVVTIGIKRGKNFDEDVALSFADVPKDVTHDPAAPVIKKGDENAKVTFKVGENAGLGDHEIKVTGKPTKGESASKTFKITVEKK